MWTIDQKPLTDADYAMILQMLRPNRSFVLELALDETPAAVTERLWVLARTLDLPLTIMPLGSQQLRLVRHIGTYADPATTHFSPAEQAHFWQSVERRGPDDCWPWRGQSSQRAGRFHAHGRSYTAHRVAYTLTYGPIPPEKPLRHTCGTYASCCNPAHLVRRGTTDSVVAAQMGVPTPHPIAYRKCSRMANGEARFWAFVDRGDMEACWAWRGPVASDGTARFFYKGRRYVAQRLAYEWLIGPLPSTVRLRACPKLKLCVNPWHHPGSPVHLDDEDGFEERRS